jgi:hypothetical protein
MCTGTQGKSIFSDYSYLEKMTLASKILGSGSKVLYFFFWFTSAMMYSYIKY